MATAFPLRGPVLLDKSHEISAFDCGATPLNDYLHKHAWHNQQNRSARTYVVLRGDKVVGYYSLAAASVQQEEATPRLAKGLAKHPIPVVLLARLAVDQAEKGQPRDRTSERRSLAVASSSGRHRMVKARSGSNGPTGSLDVNSASPASKGSSDMDWKKKTPPDKGDVLWRRRESNPRPVAL
jgi:hypothetical protein